MINSNNLQHNGTFGFDGVPAELKTTAAALDALAGRDRAAATAGIEDRVAEASLSALRGGSSVRLVGSAAPVRRPVMVTWGLRVAAAVAIAAGSIGLYVASRSAAPGPATPTPRLVAGADAAGEQSIDAVLATLAQLDTAVGLADLENVRDTADGVDWSLEDPLLEPSSVLESGS